ncbi:hypothetical protein Poly51_52700 [Rubripirellula tenax]|uniref:DUF1552 domain-containing protein n=1 Tax=Rubripirellula tenax TaxID=2528015 RepID=A0A5C6EFV0_9BACT|nr:DUF1552 domain-containing protein [Rubripirellula tenax]TWU47470.1 hypothetical protein Poly51_52700 [Rubripirellula tenax]
MSTASPLVDRRRILRGSGLALALPMLESISPRRATAAAVSSPRTKRLVTIGTYLGFHLPSFSPSEQGRDYTMSPVLKPLEDLRNEFSVFSGLDHRAPNGHQNWKNYLTGKGTPGISLDQIVAKSIGDQTRFESLQVTCGSGAEGRMSFTKEGIALPAIGRPSVLFGHLFRSGTDKARMGYLLDSGGSVLDLALDEASVFQRQVNARDAAKLDEYFTSVREVEKKLQKQRDWLDVPTPKVTFELPDFDPVAPDLSLECESIMYDLMALALETDSTRVISFIAPGQGQVFTIDGEKLSAGYHGLSHHGNDPSKIADFNRVGAEHVRRFGNFLRQLNEKKDVEGRPLLETTAVLFGSGMGDANTHNNSHLPILLAGGGFKHGVHHSIDRSDASRSTPLLGDLFLTVMESMGLEEQRFVKANRNMNEYLL